MPSPSAALGEDARQKSIASSVSSRRRLPGPDTARPPAGPLRCERERLAVRTRPLGDDVGDDAAVVFGVDVERFARRNRQVDPVHPGVACEAHVEQVRHRLPTDGLGEVEQAAAGRSGGAASCAPAPRAALPVSHSAMSSSVVERGALAYLHLVHSVPPVLAADLRHERVALALPDGRTRVATLDPRSNPTTWAATRAHVPQRAVGRTSPSRQGRSCAAARRTSGSRPQRSPSPRRARSSGWRSTSIAWSWS